MGKGKQIEAELHLPEAIIHHIQSFLTGKEAAQTTILSKSWYSAWLTRPSLDFDERHFIRVVDGRLESSFVEFVMKTVQRYEELNLKIQSLSLTLVANDGFHGNAKNSIYSLAHELIMKAIDMGATDIYFKNAFQDIAYAFPSEVFGSENLVRLSVEGCKIDLGTDGRVSCSRLESLSLKGVYVKGDIFWNLISTCAVIEKLSLYNCQLLYETQNPASNVLVKRTSRLVFSPFIESGKCNEGSVVDGPSIVSVFHKLKCLSLSWIDVDTLFFDDFSSKFPCLKVLEIHNCRGYKTIQISSLSLEFVSFTQQRILRANFDVPRIRKFTFSGSDFPTLVFINTTSNWESDISIRRCSAPSTLWFHKLNKLLRDVSQSKVSLSLEIESVKSFDYAGIFQGLPKPEVENLTIDVPYSVFSALFNSLFQCCFPIYVTRPCYSASNLDIIEFDKRLIQLVGSNCCIPNQSMSGKCNLKQVDVEFYDEAVSAWRPRLLDASTSSGADEQRLRLHLKWGR